MRIIGRLVLAATIVACFGVAATSALAAPVWEQCVEGAAGTKYESSQCKTASATGKWAWSEITGTEPVEGRSSLTLRDTKVPVVGTVEIKCTGVLLGAVSQGTVGPGKFARLLEVREINCSAGKNCEKIEGPAEPRNLPWQTELFETEATVRGKITNGKTGSEAPGWAITCKVLGITEKDVCVTENSSGLVENKVSSGELLVQGTFEAKTPKGNCTIGGTGASEQLGAGFVTSANGSGLRVRGAG
jgi:hypothetical protein